MSAEPPEVKSLAAFLIGGNRVSKVIREKSSLTAENYKPGRQR